MYASFLGTSEALQLDIFHQPLRTRFSNNLVTNTGFIPLPLHISNRRINLLYDLFLSSRRINLAQELFISKVL